MIESSQTGAGAAGLVSIVIKAYNEEAKIARAIESALAAADELKPHRLEVVVADSCSTDRTVEIARRYPVRVVQLAPTEERGCGVGLQMGYAWSSGAWVYLMDGDMALAPGFLAEALPILQRDQRLAGVGGGVVDERITNAFDRIRVNNRAGTRAGSAPWLVGGGLYRRQAIDDAGGYAADRNLKGCEEAELGLRLTAAGYTLQRLPRAAVSHLGHDLGTWALLARHWRSRRAMSTGVMLRSALRQPWWWATLRMNMHPLVTMVWWMLLLALLVLAPSAWRGSVLAGWGAVSLAVALLLAVVKRDARHAVSSVVSWHYAAAAIVKGWFEPRVDPKRPIDATLLQDVPSP